jgi:hypothetical protein
MVTLGSSPPPAAVKSHWLRSPLSKPSAKSQSAGGRVVSY